MVLLVDSQTPERQRYSAIEASAKQKERLKQLALSSSASAIALMCFCVLSAWVIQSIESAGELPRKSKLQLVDEMLHGLLNLSQVACTFNSSAELNGTTNCIDVVLVNELVQTYKDTVLTKIISDGVTTEKPRWSFSGSTFYCWTVVATVGYGNYFPVKSAGKTFTMIYASLGMPLLVLNALTLSNTFTIFIKRIKEKIVRGFLGHVRRKQWPPAWNEIRQMNRKLTALVTKRKRIRPFPLPPDSMISLWIASFIFPLYLAVAAAYFYALEPLSYFESYYFAFITVTSIGFGDIVPTNEVGFLFASIFVFLGIGLCSSVVEYVEGRMIRFSSDFKRYLVYEFGREGNEEHSI